MKKKFTFVCASLIYFSGCALFNSDDKILETMSKTIDTAVAKASAETKAETASMHGSAQGINPGYTVEFSGKIVNGFEGKAKVYLDGVAGQISGASQAKAKKEPIPDPPTTTNTAPISWNNLRA